MTWFLVSYEKDGKIVTIFCRNKQEQTSEFLKAKRKGLFPTKSVK